MVRRRLKETVRLERVEELKADLRRSRAQIVRLRKAVASLRVCRCKDKSRDCLRCGTPFDPSWSKCPSIENFCDEFCRKEYRRFWGHE